MAYTIHVQGPSEGVLGTSRVTEAVRIALDRAIAKDGRFRARLTSVVHAPRTRTMPEGWMFEVRYVRLTTAKSYCGQHPGSCLVGGPRKRAAYLEWDDWVAFHAIVNDVLDRLEVTAAVWSTPMEVLAEGKKMWIRRGNKRRIRWGWDERAYGAGRIVRVWNVGTPDQFESELARVVGDE